MKAWHRQILLNNARDAERRFRLADKRDCSHEVPIDANGHDSEWVTQLTTPGSQITQAEIKANRPRPTPANNCFFHNLWTLASNKAHRTPVSPESFTPQPQLKTQVSLTAQPFGKVPATRPSSLESSESKSNSVVRDDTTSTNHKCRPALLPGQISAKCLKIGSSLGGHLSRFTQFEYRS
jgi:hypothetical protein